MTIQPRPRLLHEPVDSFRSLQRWIDVRLAGVEEDLADPEIAQANGRQLRERRATLLDVQHEIRAALAVEEAESAVVAREDSIENQWRDAYPDADELTLRRMAGDR